MLKNLGPLGIAGVVILVVGIGLIASADLAIAAGLALVLAGVGLMLKSLVTTTLRSFGMV